MESCTSVVARAAVEDWAQKQIRAKRGQLEPEEQGEGRLKLGSKKQMEEVLIFSQLQGPYRL